MGVDAENFPIGLTEAERLAASLPGLPNPNWKELHMQPLVSPKVAGIAATIGFFLVGASEFASGVTTLPAWVTVAAWGLGAFALFLAGQGVSAPKFLRPAVGASLVPLFVSLGAGVRGFAETFTGDSALKAGLALVSAILVGLAGKVAPQTVATPVQG